MEERAVYQVTADHIVHIDSGCMMDVDGYVTIPRRELEQEHNVLIARVNQIRKLLGYAPLQTGKQLRREHKR